MKKNNEQELILEKVDNRLSKNTINNKLVDLEKLKEQLQIAIYQKNKNLIKDWNQIKAIDITQYDKNLMNSAVDKFPEMVNFLTKQGAPATIEKYYHDFLSQAKDKSTRNIMVQSIEAHLMALQTHVATTMEVLKWYVTGDIKLEQYQVLNPYLMRPVDLNSRELPQLHPRWLKLINTEGKTLIDIAVEQKQLKLLKSFEKITKKDGKTLLHYAVNFSHITTVKYLLQPKNAKLNNRDSNGNTLLHIAAKRNNQEIIDFLLTMGAKLHFLNNDQENIFEYAADLGFNSYIRCIAYDFFDAIDEGNTVVIKKILENNKSWFFLNTFDLSDKKTPVEYAIDLCKRFNKSTEQSKKGFKSLKCLLAISIKDSQKLLPEIRLQQLMMLGSCQLPVLTISSNYQIIEDLIDIAKKNKDRHMLNQIKTILIQSQKIDINDNTGKTALHIAVKQNNIEMVKLLVKIGSDVNAADSFGQTALHYVAILENAASDKICELLIANGADLSLTDTNKKRADEIASKNNAIFALKSNFFNAIDGQITEYIEKALTENLTWLFIKNEKSKNPLEYAREQKKLRALGDLTKHAVLNLSKLDKSQLKFLKIRMGDVKTALQVVIYQKESSSIKYLIEFLTKQSTKNFYINNEILMNEAVHHFSDIVNFLMMKGVEPTVNACCGSELTKNKEIHEVTKQYITELNNHVGKVINLLKKYAAGKMNPEQHQCLQPYSIAIINKGELPKISKKWLTLPFSEDDTLVHIAVVNEQLDILKSLRVILGDDWYALVNKKSNDDQTPLHLAVERFFNHCNDNSANVIQFLLEEGACVGIENKKHQTPLEIASEKIKLKKTKEKTLDESTKSVMKQLKKANKELRQNRGKLKEAIRRGKVDFIKQLNLKEIGKLNLLKPSNNLLKLAGEEERPKIFQLLVDLQMKIDLKNTTAVTKKIINKMIFCAALQKKWNLLSWYYQQGANFDLQCKYYPEPGADFSKIHLIMFAIAQQNDKAVKLLIEQFNVNLEVKSTSLRNYNFMTYTPLALALMKNNKKITKKDKKVIELLLQAGADPTELVAFSGLLQRQYLSLYQLPLGQYLIDKAQIVVDIIQSKYMVKEINGLLKILNKEDIKKYRNALRGYKKSADKILDKLGIDLKQQIFSCPLPCDSPYQIFRSKVYANLLAWSEEKLMALKNSAEAVYTDYRKMRVTILKLGLGPVIDRFNAMYVNVYCKDNNNNVLSMIDLIKELDVLKKIYIRGFNSLFGENMNHNESYYEILTQGLLKGKVGSAIDKNNFKYNSNELTFFRCVEIIDGIEAYEDNMQDLVRKYDVQKKNFFEEQQKIYNKLHDNILVFKRLSQQLKLPALNIGLTKKVSICKDALEKIDEQSPNIAIKEAEPPSAKALIICSKKLKELKKILPGVVVQLKEFQKAQQKSHREHNNQGIFKKNNNNVNNDNISINKNGFNNNPMYDL